MSGAGMMYIAADRAGFAFDQRFRQDPRLLVEIGRMLFLIVLLQLCRCGDLLAIVFLQGLQLFFQAEDFDDLILQRPDIAAFRLQLIRCHSEFRLFRFGRGKAFLLFFHRAQQCNIFFGSRFVFSALLTEFLHLKFQQFLLSALFIELSIFIQLGTQLRRLIIPALAFRPLLFLFFHCGL